MKIGFFKSWFCFAFQSKSQTPNFCDQYLKSAIQMKIGFFKSQLWCTFERKSQTPHFCDLFLINAMQMKIGCFKSQSDPTLLWSVFQERNANENWLVGSLLVYQDKSQKVHVSHGLDSKWTEFPWSWRRL